jgi:hypothetical protein
MNEIWHLIYCDLVHVLHGWRGGIISVVLAIPATTAAHFVILDWTDFVILWLIRILAIAASVFSIHASIVVAKAKKLQIKQSKDVYKDKSIKSYE